jgi:hypothetical protein
LMRQPLVLWAPLPSCFDECMIPKRSHSTQYRPGSFPFPFESSRCVASQRRDFLSAVCVFFLTFTLYGVDLWLQTTM